MLLSPHPDLLPEGEGTNIKDWSVHPLPMGEGRDEGIQKIKKNQTLVLHPLNMRAGTVIRDCLCTLSPWEQEPLSETACAPSPHGSRNGHQRLAEHPLPTEAGMVIRDWLGTLSPWERAGVRESKNVSTSVT